MKLYIITIHDPDDGSEVHVLPHLVRARDERDAVWQIVQAYGFRGCRKCWRVVAHETS